MRRNCRMPIPSTRRKPIYQHTTSTSKENLNISTGVKGIRPTVGRGRRRWLDPYPGSLPDSFFSCAEEGGGRGERGQGKGGRGGDGGRGSARGKAGAGQAGGGAGRGGEGGTREGRRRGRHKKKRKTKTSSPHLVWIPKAANEGINKKTLNDNCVFYGRKLAKMSHGRSWEIWKRKRASSEEYARTEGSESSTCG